MKMRLSGADLYHIRVPCHPAAAAGDAAGPAVQTVQQGAHPDRLRRRDPAGGAGRRRGVPVLSGGTAADLLVGGTPGRPRRSYLHRRPRGGRRRGLRRLRRAAAPPQAAR